MVGVSSRAAMGPIRGLIGHKVVVMRIAHGQGRGGHADVAVLGGADG